VSAEYSIWDDPARRMDPSIFMGITEKEIIETDEDGVVTRKKVYTRGLGGQEVAFEDLTDADFPEPDPIP
jgi:hypothetical protein